MGALTVQRILYQYVSWLATKFSESINRGMCSKDILTVHLLLVKIWHFRWFFVVHIWIGPHCDSKRWWKMVALKKKDPAKFEHFAAPPGVCSSLTATVTETHHISASWLPLRPYAARLGAVGWWRNQGECSLLAEPEAPAEALFLIPFPSVRKVKKRRKILKGQLTGGEWLLHSKLGERSWLSGLDCIAVSSRSQSLLKRRLMEARNFPTKLVLVSCITLASGQ